MTQRYVIAGGPGSGKTTLLQALAARGEICYQEVARALIREPRPEGRLAPWLDVQTFAEECARRMREQLNSSPHERRCFFDRGLPDLIGYLNRDGKEPPLSWCSAARLYAPVVFFAPPWPQIYVNDEERPQSLAEATVLGEHVRHAYLECGFRVIDLVQSSVAERTRQVLRVLDG